LPFLKNAQLGQPGAIFLKPPLFLGVPGLDLPGLGIAALARGWGCRAVDVETTEDLEQEFKTALSADTTTVIVVRTQPQKAML
jgi:benzoylformate decarboxylase